MGQNTLNWLSSSVSYTEAQVSSVISAMVPMTLTSISNTVYQGEVLGANLPTAGPAQPYLYLVWDLRSHNSAELCWDSHTSVEACCDCVQDCEDIVGSRAHANQDAACNDPSLDITYKTTRVQPEDLEVGDFLYIGSCIPANAAESGWYKFASTDGLNFYSVFVGFQGIIISVVICR